MRTCGQRDRAIEWYQKALALSAGDLEARFHLCHFAEEDGDARGMLIHARLLVRHLLDRRVSRNYLNYLRQQFPD